MISFKGGILRIEKNKNRDLFRLPFEICLFLGIIFYFSYQRVIHYSGVALLILGPVIITAGKLYNKQLNNPILSVWYLAFTAFAELSSSWAYSPHTAALKFIKFMLISLTVGFGITQYVNSKKDIEQILNIYLYSSLVIALSEFIGTPVDRWFSGYFGSVVSHNNSNLFGFIILYAAIIAFYKAYLLHKRYWYPAVLLFLFGCILSSSRKAVLMSFFGIIIIILFAFKRKHHIFHFFLIGGAIAVLFTLFMTDDILYDTIGQRLETLIKFANNEQTKYGSLQIREYYINFAKTLFERNPIIGQGFLNFSNHLAIETDFEINYAHNNYWEILADLGIAGFILYYWLYAYILIKLATDFFKKKFTSLRLLAFSMLTAELILEWGVVSMYSVLYQVAVILIFLCATTDDTENPKQFYYSNNTSGLSGG